jgi:hypothetical protein
MKALQRLAAAAGALAISMAVGAAQAATVETTNFIGSPTYFNGFEGMCGCSGYIGSHTEGGIKVEYVGTYNDIWTTSQAGEGSQSWYPDGGGTGYTRITLASLADFANIQFMASSGFFGGGATLFYELLNNGVSVQTGAAGPAPGYLQAFAYYGFSGGGFDEVRLQAQFGSQFSTSNFEAGAYDAIAANGATVPEPAIWALMIGGFGMAGAALRRRRAFAATA